MDKIQMFKENMSTFKATSLDDNGVAKEYMTQSEIEVVDFDEVKNSYIRKLGLRLENPPCSSDALYECEPGKFYFVEFKNGRLHQNDIYSIQKKIYDSLLIFNDIMNTNISFCRENVGFILVYNESKNPDQNLKAEAPSPSRDKIGKYFSKKAGTSFIRFGLGQFKKIYFHDIYTYTTKEFEREFLNAK